MNFSELMQKAKEAPGFSVLPVGRYTVKASKTEAKVAASGKDMISVDFIVISGPYANQHVFNQYVISPDNANAIAFFLRHMQAFGITTDFLASEPGVPGLAAALVGRVVQVDVIIDNTYDGTDRNKVKSTFPPPAEYSNSAAVNNDPFRAMAEAARPVTALGGATPGAPRPPF